MGGQLLCQLTYRNGQKCRWRDIFKLPAKQRLLAVCLSVPHIRVYDDAGNVIEMHEHTGDFKEWQ